MISYDKSIIENKESEYRIGGKREFCPTLLQNQNINVKILVSLLNNLVTWRLSYEYYA